MPDLSLFDRTRNRLTFPEVIVRSFARMADGLVVATSRPRPVYTPKFDEDLADESQALFRREVAAADVGGPAAGELGFDLANFGSLSFFWRNAPGSTRLTIDAVWWVRTGLGWVRMEGGAVNDLGPDQEVHLDGLAYRRAFCQVTEVTGGAGGLRIYCGGE